MSPFIRALKKYWYVVVIVVVLTTIASFVLSIIQKPEYESSVKLLVIQKQEGKLDAYTAARSAETVAGILSKMVYTSTFFDQVMASGFDVSKDDFSKEPEKRKEDWKRAVDARVIEDSGTIQVDVYHESKHRAEQLAYAIAYVLINKGRLYHGGEMQIEVKMVDAPITSEKPARPSVLRNTAAGFALGLLASLGIIFLISERIERRAGEKLEIKTMPKVEEVRRAERKRRVGEKRTEIEGREEEAKPSVVRERMKTGFEEVLVPKEGERPTPKRAKIPPSEEIRPREAKERMALGVEKIGAKKERPKPAPGEVVFKPGEEREEKEKKKEPENKYAPERVERWIKTGKFD
jgi:capsular polysaccharide biosynthesis protein